MISAKQFRNLITALIDTLRKNVKQISILLILTIVVSLFFHQGRILPYSYQVDDIAREPIITPFNFPILKTEEKLQDDLDAALRSEPYVFIRNQAVVATQIRSLQDYFTLVSQIRSSAQQMAKTKGLLYRYRHDDKYNEIHSMTQADSAKLAVLQSQYEEQYPALVLPPERLPLFQTHNPFDTERSLNTFRDNLLQICRNRWAEGVIDIETSAVISNEVAIDQGDIPVTYKPAELTDLNIAWTRSKKEINSLYSEEGDVRRGAGYIILVEFLKPNIIYDKEITERRQQNRLDRVPRNQGIMLQNEMIVDANQRITPDIYQKLTSLSVAISKKEKREKHWAQAVAYIGRILVVAVIISFFFTFLLAYRSHIFNDWKMVLLIALIFTVNIILTDLFVYRFEFSEYLIPITVASMMLTILFDARIGFMGTTSIAILCGILIGNDLEFIVTVMFISSVAMFMVRRLRNRNQFITAILAMMAASLLVVFAHGLYKGHAWPEMQIDIIYLMVTSLLTPIIAYGLISIVEVTFGMTTDLTLLELLDFNHPLLKRMQRNANGTFNHSVVVGNLAEACADAIDARALLCRVGAYYHDIGKMVRPEYFIENQYGAENLHDSLTPTLSAKIIRNHVTEGLKLANEYGLPKIVGDFIPMHHGTTRVEYFYRKALEKAQTDGEEVDEHAFRYPGPKPNSKETGILMLCEAIEAAVRSIKDLDMFKVEEMINKIIKKRLDEHQLNECPLTMDELHRVVGKINGQTGMLPVLRGIYHIRIEYPNEPTSEKTTAA